MDAAAEQFEKLYLATRVNKTEARRHARGMLRYLQVKFPLPAGVTVVMILQDSKTSRIRQASGIVKCVGKISVGAETKVATIKVVLKDRTTFSILGTVAHEYRHALQVFVEGRTLAEGYDHPTEVEARVFGAEQRMEYVDLCSLVTF